MIEIHVRKPYVHILSKKDIRLSLQKVIDTLFPDEKFDFGILICSDTEIQKLNQQFRNVYSSTDVLSFESAEILPDDQLRYLGDIIVSYDTALVQSEKIGHSINIEIIVLIIHGLLHLLGFDHDTESNKSMMWQKQFEALEILELDAKGFSGEND